MLFWDVNNGIARRAWARNEGAVYTAKREVKRSKNLQITLPNMVEDRLLDKLF
jgi:urocanate hydratase